MPTSTSRPLPASRRARAVAAVGAARLTLGLTLAVACAGGDATATGPGGEGRARTPHFARAAQAGGADVARSPLLLFGVGFGGEPTSGYAIVLGLTDPAAAVDVLCSDPTATLPLAPGRAQQVVTPSGALHIVQSGAEVPVAVFAYGAGITTSPCDLVGAPVAATGAVRLHYVARVDGAGATVFQVGARGTVTLAGGGAARLTATWRQVVRPDGTLLFDLEPVTLAPR